MGSFSVWHWVIVLLIVVLVFGTSKPKKVANEATTNTVDVTAKEKTEAKK